MRRGLQLLAAGAAASAAAELWRRRNLPAPPRTVLVTGGSRGLGLVLSREYRRAGARVAICARDDDELERAEEVLARENGDDVLARRCDLADRTQVTAFVDEVCGRWGAIDAVVNNAGIMQVGPFEHMTQADYEAAMRVHFWASLHVTDAALPAMRARGSGRIVNIASIAALLPVPHMLPYSASKAALLAWSDGLRAELAGTGIFVTSVCPATMRTGSPRNAQFKGRHREEYAWFSILDSLPLVSISAERAARRIIRASRLGHARVIVPGYARLPVALYAALPELTLAAIGVANRWLPDPGGIGSAALPGSQSSSPASPSWITTLTERAAQRNNEV